MIGRVLGCDPGLDGALALVDVDRSTVEVFDIPTVVASGRRRINVVELADLIDGLFPISHAWIEDVGPRSGEGAVGAFSFGRGVGQLQGIVTALGIPVSFVRPDRWKKAMGCPAEKSGAVARAQTLVPSIASRFRGPKGGFEDGRAEAAMIALYGARKLAGED